MYIITVNSDNRKTNQISNSKTEICNILLSMSMSGTITFLKEARFNEPQEIFLIPKKYFFNNKAPVIMLACYGQIEVLSLFYVAKGLSTGYMYWFDFIK